jgi:predicted nucleotidyltransferase
MRNCRSVKVGQYVNCYLACSDGKIKIIIIFGGMNLEEIMSKIPISYRDDIIHAIELLKKSGCREIYLFGSLVEGDLREGSDIDIAIRGIDANKYFKILGHLMLELNHPVDLINLDREDDFSRYLEREGELLHVQ